MSVVKDYKVEWEESYARGDNNILYPQVEVIRFLNRYVCKRNNDKTITQVIKTLNNRTPRGLDFACGVGTHCITFADFGVDGWGVDISSNAIQQAKKNASVKSLSTDQFIELDATKQVLPFENNFFDFVVAESCLDSMPLDIAKKYIAELKRVCSGLVYVSLIGKDDQMTADEFVVENKLELGTYQTTFNEDKITELLGAQSNDFIHFSLVSFVDVASRKVEGKRYYCVIESQNLHSEISG
jgi:SAM-dependent methyltransferase